MTTGDSTANKEFKKEIIETHSAQETFALGQRIGLEALPGQVYTLIGDLGVGKTVFTQGVADGLGITEPVNSPTFTIVNEYEGGRLPLFHFDMYRLGSADDLFDIGWEDFLRRGGVCAVEWSETVQEALDADTIYVDIRRGAEDNQRVLTIRGPGFEDLPLGKEGAQ